MKWPYHFVDLSIEEKQNRRHLLDWYGALAQVSVFIPLLVQQLYFLLVWLGRRWQNQADFEAPSSPQLKRIKSSRRCGLDGLKVTYRRCIWWCGDPAIVAGVGLGTKGQVTAATGWTAWLLVLCFVQTGDDYFHLTKRFGIIASSNLPLHYLLALKSPWSPFQLLTRCSHETLNILHQTLGRVIHAFLYLHAAFYLAFFIQARLLATKLKAPYILCGLFAILAFTAIGTTALAPIRHRNYRIFYTVHVALATLLLPILFFHVSHIRPYLYETAAIYALNAALRFFSTKTLPACLRLLPSTNLLEIAIPKTSTQTFSYHPAQHAYLSVPSHPLLRTFRSNPFTLASLPYSDEHLRFVARVLDGNTAALASALKSPETDPDHPLSLPLTLEGPYGLSTHSDTLLNYDRILFLAGGVGGTFIVPLYRQLLADLSPSKGSYRRQKVSFVWVVRSKAEMEWAVPKEGREREGFVERLRVCVTGGLPGAVVRGKGDPGLGAEDGRKDLEEAEEGIEMQEQRHLLSSSADEGNGEGKDGDVPLYASRPDLRRLVEQTFKQGDGSEKVAVVVCGPKSLSWSLRREVAPWMKRGREVWFWEEAFGL